ncbi:hypothetical protein [Actinokineospora sp. HUAS TT18]|uniref:hypothetical protein n=1 Tax=Actinokineospora sp. HUAS TT18 TaxID=3447451 RepID=UPI003F5282F4
MDPMQERFAARGWRRARRFALFGLALAIGALVVAGAVRYWPADNSCAGQTPAGMIVTFGLGRESTTRTITVPLPETTADAATDSVVAVRVRGDLQREGDSAQFPASQVTVGSTQADGQTVSITAAVAPAIPERVPAGCYRGELVVDRAGAASRVVPLVVDLASREGWRSAQAFAVLTAGALLGLAIKWITESLTPLAVQRRRLDGLKRSLRIPQNDDDVLPFAIQGKLIELEQLIDRHEITELDTLFRELEGQRAEISYAVDIIVRLKNLVRKQEVHFAKLEWRGGSPSQDASSQVVALITMEHDKIVDFRHRWRGTSDPTAVAESAQELVNGFQSVGMFLGIFAKDYDNQILRAARDAYLSGDFAAGRAKVAEYDQSVSPKEGAGRSGLWFSDFSDEESARVPRVGVMEWLVRHARLLAAMGSVVIVAFVGLSTQYLDVAKFRDDLGDWLALFLWAAVVELSGVSVLDVVARLGNVTNASSGRASAPRPTPSA